MAGNVFLKGTVGPGLFFIPYYIWVVLFHHEVRPQHNTGLKATVLTALTGLDSFNL